MPEEIKAIAEEIRRRTEKEVKEILEKAKKEAERIIEEAKNESEKIFQHEAHSRLMIIRRRILGTAEYEARKKIILAKNEIVQKVYENALEELKKIAKGLNPKYDYKEILYLLIKEAVVTMDEPEVIVKANEIDMKYLIEHAGEIQRRIKQETGLDTKIKVASEPVNIIGGIIAENYGKTKIYHNTLEGRLRKAFEKLKPELAKVLFGE
ncbi:MAG: V-type ATP synthase subunit E [Candidatus Njordarchaeia archaeon]